MDPGRSPATDVEDMDWKQNNLFGTSTESILAINEAKVATKMSAPLELKSLLAAYFWEKCTRTLRTPETHMSFKLPPKLLPQRRKP